MHATTTILGKGKGYCYSNNRTELLDNPRATSKENLRLKLGRKRGIVQYGKVDHGLIMVEVGLVP